MQIDRPRRPARSLDDFRILFTGRAVHKHGAKRVDSPNFWPCIECSGGGRVRDPADRDPVEGYKLAPWHKCSLCKGTGKGTKEAIKAIYDKAVADYRAARDKFDRLTKARRQALKKLTKEEKQAIAWLGVW